MIVACLSLANCQHGSGGSRMCRQNPLICLFYHKPMEKANVLFPFSGFAGIFAAPHRKDAPSDGRGVLMVERKRGVIVS